MEKRLQRFMYHSELAPSTDIGCIQSIIRSARAFNEKQGITGILIFDGQRFSQYIEGCPFAIDVLISKLPKDSRHVNFVPQHNSIDQCERIFSAWHMAYVFLDDEDPLSELSKFHGHEAIEKLEQLLPELDLG